MSLKVAQSAQIPKFAEEKKRSVLVKPEQKLREEGEDELP